MSREKKFQIVGVAIGVAYGLAMRGLMALSRSARWADSLMTVMSIAFIIVVPFAMGYLTVAARAREFPVGVADRIFYPCVTVLVSLLGCAVVGWEGLICIVMITPIALACGSLGGLTAGAIVRPSQPKTGNVSLAIVALLPLLVAPVEQHFGLTRQVRSVESTVTINASPEVIWRNIEQVRRIEPRELPPAWNTSIGFPRPIEATLSKEGIGGVRHATFAGNVLFIETVDEWEPNQRLGFSIRADTRSIPPTTLDEHVTVGGPYFDVLHGEYILESERDRKTRLRLISRHRVSTDFNWYAQLWTDGVMRDVQRSILYVIKNRCERN